VIARLARIRFDDFTRHHAAGRRRQVEQEIVVGRSQADAQRVAVRCLEAGHRHIRAEARAQRGVASDLAFEHIRPGRLERGVI